MAKTRQTKVDEAIYSGDPLRKAELTHALNAQRTRPAATRLTGRQATMANNLYEAAAKNIARGEDGRAEANIKQLTEIIDSQL